MPSISTKIESKNKSTRTATLWGFNASHSKSISIYIVLTLWSWATFNSSGKAFYKIYRMSEGNVWPSIQKCICEVRHCGRMSRGGCGLQSSSYFIQIGVWWGRGRSAVSASQSRPLQIAPNMILWTLLCTQKHSHTSTEIHFPQTAFINLEAKNSPQWHELCHKDVSSAKQTKKLYMNSKMFFLDQITCKTQIITRYDILSMKV